RTDAAGRAGGRERARATAPRRSGHRPARARRHRRPPGGRQPRHAAAQGRDHARRQDSEPRADRRREWIGKGARRPGGASPLPAQAKLLRVIEQRQVSRLGGNRTISVDARIVAATNRDLEAEVAAGRFRQDLLYRLNVHVVRVPALRERLSDLPALVEELVTTTCARFGVRPKKVDAAALDSLLTYEWKRNNVRELRNVVER